MTDPHDQIALNTAIARLQDFIDTYPDGEQIDGDMPLTKDDVLMVIEAATSWDFRCRGEDGNY